LGRRERASQFDRIGVDVPVVVEARVLGKRGEELVVYELGPEAVHASRQEYPRLDAPALRCPALLVHGADLDRHDLGLHRLAIHRDLDRHRLVLFAPVPEQVHAHDVLGVVLDDVVHLEDAGVETAHPVLAVEDAGLGQRISADGPRRDSLGRHQVLLHVGGRDGQRRADVVEPVDRIVGGEFLGRAEIHAEKVADGVGVLVPIEAMRHHAPGVGLGVLVGLVELGLDELHERLDGRLLDPLRRHLAASHLGEDQLPGVAVFHDAGRIQELLDGEAAGCELLVMAGGAGIRQDGLDVLLESSRRCERAEKECGYDSPHG
jgi:hypothetical protein